MLVYLGICAALAFLAALVVALLAVLPAPTFVLTRICLADAMVSAPAFALHIAFAAGAMPLIFGAIIHFVPVLTRTAGPERSVNLLPLPVQVAGLLTPLALAGVIPYETLHLAAGVASLAAVFLLVWIMRRMRATLGMPHPGVRWYGAALLCLFFAVSLVPVWLALPGLRTALRLFHLHLNTLGFIGLAALGTLPVLLPTVLGRPDQTAGLRLRSDLPLAIAGALLVAAGAMGTAWLGLPGALLLLWVAGRNLWAWWWAFKRSLLDPAAAPLVVATGGFCLLLLAGIAHAWGHLSPRAALVGFSAGFLIPLVTGALAQLLPVWAHPGPDSPRRQRMRALLVWGGEWRALLFLSSGAAFIFDSGMGAWPLVLGLLWFLSLLVAAFVLDTRDTTDDNPAP